jgi:hypothetical protein
MTPTTWIASNIPSDLSVLQLLHRLVEFRKTNHGGFEAEFSFEQYQYLSGSVSYVAIPRRAKSMVSSTSAIPATSVPLMD